MNARTACRRAALIGGASWCTALLIARPYIFGVDWARALLLLAPLVVLPLLFETCSGVARKPAGSREWRLTVAWSVAVCALAWAEFLPVGRSATLFASPWAAMLLAFGLREWSVARHPLELLRSPAVLCARSAPLLGIVGAVWLLFDRAGVRPLDLPEELVLLTAIHFHFAGVALPLITSRLLGDRRDRLAWITAGLATGGVPLVAIGITATQLGAPVIIESIAAWSMALGGLLVALQLVTSAHAARGLARVLGHGAALALVAAMSLSVCYAARHWLDLAWMGIPWMRGVHGTLNAIGFGVLGALHVSQGRAEVCVRSPEVPRARSGT